MGNSAQMLPPKMAQQFAELAKDGKADKVLGGNLYLFWRGTQEICLVSLDPPQGHVSKLTAQEMKDAKSNASR